MVKQKTVLAFIDWYRPGYKAGGTVTSFGNFVDHLESYFDFKIITRDTDFQESNVYPSINSDSWNVLEESKCYYVSTSNLSIRLIKKIIENTPHDYIYINGVFSFYFSILPLIFSREDCCIINPHGMLSDQAFSVKALKKKIFLKFANSFGLFKHVVFHVSNEDEADSVKKRINVFKSIKIANQFPRKLKHNFQLKTKKNNPIRFVNIARVSIEKGTLHLLKAVGSLDQALVLDLYGPIYDKDYWQKCQAVISELPAHVRVNYKGVLESDDVPVTLMQYDFFALLSEGENFGHAILEALSAGLPVLISDQTPWTDLEAQRVGWDLALDDVTVIHEAFNAALNMPNATYKLWSQAAFDFAKAFVEDDAVLDRNRSLFSHLPPACRQTGLP